MGKSDIGRSPEAATRVARQRPSEAPFAIMSAAPSSSVIADRQVDASVHDCRRIGTAGIPVAGAHYLCLCSRVMFKQTGVCFPMRYPMSIHQPQHHTPSGRSSYTSARTPVADFLVSAIQTIFLTAIILFFALATAGLAGLVVVDGIGSLTGATAAWAALVAKASAEPHGPIEASSIFAQNLVCGTIISLVLAAPALRRCLRRDSVKWLAKEMGSPEAVAALRLGVTCLVIHLLISLAVAALLSALGFIVPAPGGFHMVVAPLTFAAGYLGGGGWPPGADDLSSLAIVLIILLWFGGALIATAIYSMAFGAAAMMGGGHFLGARIVSGGIAGVGSAFGALIASVLYAGSPYKRWQFDSFRMVMVGAVKGMATGSLYIIILLAGAAILGVG
jgi:hypothetical protein